MKIGAKQFIGFAYGDKRKDKSRAQGILDELAADYEPAKDRYKQFREAMTSFESRRISESNFLTLYANVTPNKSSGYKVLSRNYLDLKEDHALTWQGRSPIEADLAGLTISTSWYLRTEESNQRRIIFLHFGKDPLPRKQERGMLTLLRLAKPESAGVGILNLQPGTLITATRLDQEEADFLVERAAKFLTVANSLKRE